MALERLRANVLKAASSPRQPGETGATALVMKGTLAIAIPVSPNSGLATGCNLTD